jgi:hypothetical protein
VKSSSEVSGMTGSAVGDRVASEMAEAALAGGGSGICKPIEQGLQSLDAGRRPHPHALRAW